MHSFVEPRNPHNAPCSADKSTPTPRMRASRRKLGIAIVATYAAMLFGGTHWPKIIMPRLPQFMSFDKICHFTGYAILTLLLLLMPVGFFRRPEGGFRSPAWLAAMLILLAVAAASMLDEATQPLVERDMDPLDWACDISGALTALAVVTMLVGWEALVQVMSPSARPRATPTLTINPR